MPSANIIQLRQLLSEKFPGLRQDLAGPAMANFWPTGLRQIDGPLRGGLPKGTLTEIAGKNSGCATLLRQLLRHAAAENQIVTLIDAADSLDVTPLEETSLSRLLWVRCHSAGQALKAADVILRDANLPLVLLDLNPVPAKELRQIPATTWYRFQRLAEETDAVAIVFTPHRLVASAGVRITLQSTFSLGALEEDAARLLAQMEFEISDARQPGEIAEALRGSA